MTSKERLHQLVDQLPEPSADRAEAYLRTLVETGNALRAALKAAPFDDEQETAEERAAVEEAKAALHRGEVVSDEELRRQLNI